MQEITLVTKLITVLSSVSHVGLKALALLGVLPDGHSAPEHEALVVPGPCCTSEEPLKKKGTQTAEEPSQADPCLPCHVSHFLIRQNHRFNSKSADHPSSMVEELKAQTLGLDCPTGDVLLSSLCFHPVSHICEVGMVILTYL